MVSDMFSVNGRNRTDKIMIMATPALAALGAAGQSAE
jgi:hypothetical protein